MTAKIKVTNLYKAFGDNKVLDGVDIEVETGKSLVVIGGSGSGKSVLIKSILGLITPDKGNIKIDGVETTHIPLSKRYELMTKFGMLFQGGALFDSLPVWRNVAFGPLSTGQIKLSDAKALAVEKLASVGLTAEIANLFPAELSGGMQKRVALARAIAANPEIIFFDEPTTGLDPIMADVINHLIMDCTKRLGATAITITHDMHSAQKIADNVAMLYKGKIIWQGDKDQLFETENPYVQQFVRGSATGPIQMQVQDHLE